MGVVVKRQAVVADVSSTVDGLCHRADGQDGEHLLLGLALGLFQHLVDGLVDVASRALGTHLVAKVGGNVGKILQLVQVGLVVHTIDEGLGGPVLGHLADVLGHLAVGQQHELLDEFVGVLGHVDMDSRGLTRLVDFKFLLFAVE